MTNRENFLALVRRQGYERVPVEFVLCPHLQEVCKEQLGAEDYQEYFGFPWRRVDDLRLKEHDTEKYRKFYQTPLAEDADIDEWGVGHEKSPNSMHMTRMRHPLEDMETIEEIMSYPYPDYAQADGSHQKAQVESIKARDLIAIGDMQMTIWECAWYMRSMEQLFCDMMDENEIAEFLFDKVTEQSIIRAMSYVKAGVDVLFLGDDIGMQHTIMMSEELYCRWIKPRLKKLIDTVKAENPDVVIFSHQKAQVESIKARDLIALGDMQMTIWECAWYMRSMEQLFCDMMDENEIAEFLFDKVTEQSIIRAMSYVKAGVDVLFLGDDIGMQHTIMMSEKLYCRWIKPRLKKLIDTVKAENPDVVIFYHSCGFVEPFIPHLIEAGVEVLNPIQSECMDFEEIHRKYGDKISFHGTIGTQTVMPFGIPQEVKEAVWKNLDIAGEKGGLMVTPTHMLEPEVPLENILAYVEACRTYKK